MTTFVGDARQRDAETQAENDTGLGPNFPGSINDLWRMVFRPSAAFLRYVTLAVTNDDGTALMTKLEGQIALLLTETRTTNDLLRQLLGEAEELTGQSQ